MVDKQKHKSSKSAQSPVQLVTVQSGSNSVQSELSVPPHSKSGRHTGPSGISQASQGGSNTSVSQGRKPNSFQRPTEHLRVTIPPHADARSTTSHSRRPSHFKGSLIDTTTFKPAFQRRLLDLVEEAMADESPLSDPMPKELKFPTVQAPKPAPSYIESLPPGTGLTPEQLSGLEYARKIREIYNDDGRVTTYRAISTSVKFSGDENKFQGYKYAIRAHFIQAGVHYLFDKEFMTQYKQYGSKCYINFGSAKSQKQMEYDVAALYGALQQTCITPSVTSYVLPFEKTLDGVRAWEALTDRFELGGVKDIRIDTLEKTLTTPFSNRFKGGLKAWIQSYENAFTELEHLGVVTYKADADKKRRVLHNFAPPKTQESFFIRNLCRGKTFRDICDMFREQSLHIESSAKANANMTLYQENPDSNPMPVPDSGGDMDFTSLLFAHLSRVEPETWQKLPKDVQKVIIQARVKEREDALKKEDKDKPPADTKDTKKDPKKEGLKRQYEDKKINLASLELNEDMIQDYLDLAHGENSSQDDIKDVNANMTTVRVTVTESRCNNTLFLDEGRNPVIMDNGADTSVIGKGWKVIAVDSVCKANVIGFDHHASIKRGLDIVSAAAVVPAPGGDVLLVIHEAVHNPTSTHSLFSEFQLRENYCHIDSVPRRHGGSQQMLVEEKTIPFGIMDCLSYFKIRTPTATDFATLKPIEITQDFPWDPKQDKFQDDILDPLSPTPFVNILEEKKKIDQIRANQLLMEISKPDTEQLMQQFNQVLGVQSTEDQPMPDAQEIIEILDDSDDKNEHNNEEEQAMLNEMDAIMHDLQPKGTLVDASPAQQE